MIDSSAVVEVLLNTPKSHRVEELAAGQQIHAPDLIAFEVLSAIQGNLRGAKLTASGAQMAMREFEDVEANLQLWPMMEPLSDRAFELRDNVTAYDATYVTLAELLQCPLVTADAKLARASGHRAQITLV